MTALRVVVGLVFVIAGAVTIADRDVIEGAWWLLAVAAAIVGVLAIGSALRR